MWLEIRYIGVMKFLQVQKISNKLPLNSKLLKTCIRKLGNTVLIFVCHIETKDSCHDSCLLFFASWPNCDRWMSKLHSSHAKLCKKLAWEQTECCCIIRCSRLFLNLKAFTKKTFPSHSFEKILVFLVCSISLFTL